MAENKDSEERRTEFVNVAEELFKQNGVVDTTVNAIVKEMDVAKGLFYYYFKSKDDVIDAISEKYNKTFRQCIQKSLSKDDFDERLDGFLESTIVSFKTLWENLHGRNENIDLSILRSRSMDEAKQTASSELQKLLEEGNEEHKLNVANPTYFALIIISGVEELSRYADAGVEEIKGIMEDLIQRSREENK